jgi:hypothetical protein
VDHPPYSPDLSPADFWLFPELRSLLKAKRSSDVEDIKSCVGGWEEDWQTFLFRFLKTILNNGLSAGNTVKNLRDIIWKNCRLPISKTKTKLRDL